MPVWDAATLVRATSGFHPQRSQFRSGLDTPTCVAAQPATLKQCSKVDSCLSLKFIRTRGVHQSTLGLYKILAVHFRDKADLLKPIP